LLKLVHNPLQVFNDPSVISAFSVRENGNMSLSYGDTSGALENRKSFLGALNIDYKDLVCAKQVHGNSVKCVFELNKGNGALAYAASIPDTDGLITDIKNLPLAIFTADCLSIFLYDPQKPAVGVIHAGWRSTKENIVSRALNLMRSKFNTNLAELFIGFGPSIKECCYEVSAEFKDYFPTGLIERTGRFFLDLAAINKQQLTDAGVREENIFYPGACTYCDLQDFFSFRREGENAGRMLSVIMLK
jgi:polyphenol oxidase